jgi:hypothetical protein
MGIDDGGGVELCSTPGADGHDAVHLAGGHFLIIVAGRNGPLLAVKQRLAFADDFSGSEGTVQFLGLTPVRAGYEASPWTS